MQQRRDNPPPCTRRRSIDANGQTSEAGAFSDAPVAPPQPVVLLLYCVRLAVLRNRSSVAVVPRVLKTSSPAVRCRLGKYSRLRCHHTPSTNQGPDVLSPHGGQYTTTTTALHGHAALNDAHRSAVPVLRSRVNSNSIMKIGPLKAVGEEPDRVAIQFHQP